MRDYFYDQKLAWSEDYEICRSHLTYLWDSDLKEWAILRFEIVLNKKTCKFSLVKR